MKRAILSFLKRKKLIRIITIFFLLCLLSTIFISCHTTKPDDYTGLANLTINMETTENAIIMNNSFVLYNIDNPYYGWYGDLAENTIRYTDIQTGTYRLISTMDGKIIYDNIRVNKKELVRNIVLDYRKHDFTMVTIQNRTSHIIDTILSSASSFGTYVDCDGGMVTAPPSLNVNLENQNSISIILFGTHNRNVRLKSNDLIYTKYDVNLLLDNTLVFDENDINGKEIKHPLELDDYDLYDIHISIRKDELSNIFRDSISLYSLEYYKNIALFIDGMNVGIEYDGQVTGGNQEHSWYASFDFTYGQIYQIRISNDHDKNPVDETLTLHFIQDMILSVPEYLDDSDIVLKWSLYPNDYIHHYNTALSISKTIDDISPEHLYRHNEILLPMLREYSVSAGSIPSPKEGSIVFRFEYMNYSSSNRISLQNKGSASVRYLNGSLQIN